MKKTILIIIIFLLFGYRLSVAQYDAQISNYWTALNYYNPAYAGKSDNLDAILLNRLQWLGFEGAPKNMMLTGEMPMNFLGRRHGVGIMMLTESAGLFKHSLIAGQYAYKKNLMKGVLSAGIQIGYLDDAFDGGGIDKMPEDDYHDPDDEAIPTAEIKGSALDFNLGLYYSKKNWYAGFSVTHLLAPKVEMGEDYIKDLPRGYYLMGGYNILLNNPLLELQSSMLVKSTIMMTQADLSLRMTYNETFYGGLGWRVGYAEIGNSESVIVMLGGRYKNIQAGYAYDFPTSAIRIGSMGSHELYLKYTVDLNLGKKGKNKHKSVRIL